MDRIPSSHKTQFARDCLSAWRAATNGVVAKTTKDREKYWRHWCTYASMCKCDPFLRDVPPIERDIIVSAFAARVRTGTYGRQEQVRVSSVTDALSAISKTIQLAGEQSPIYHEEGVYTLVLQRMVEGYRREDPPSTPQLAVQSAYQTLATKPH